jgi:hypothetical protein
MTKQCIFCGKRVNSDEHVWPQWLLELMKKWSAGNMRLQASRLNKHGKVVYWEVEDPAIVVKNVCRTCNNGWMSDLEGEVKPILIPMIHGAATALNVRQQLIVALWLIKCDMVLDSMTSIDAFYDQSDRSHFREHLVPPEYATWWLGHYSGPHLRAFTNHRTLTDKSSVFPNKRHTSTFAFGRLVLQSLCIKVLVPANRDFVRIRDRGGPWNRNTIELLENYDRLLQWPPSLSFEDSQYTFEAFSDRFGGDRDKFVRPS